MTTDNLIVSCLSMGFTFDYFCKFKIGTILDILTEKENMLETSKDKDTTRMATLEDNIMTFF